MLTKNYTIKDLLDMFIIMRGDKGCAWIKSQNWDSLTQYIIEEAYEVVDAVERNSSKDVQEELADLLNQIVFYSCIAQEKKKFSFQDIINTLVDKIIKRHPHVFGQKNITNDLNLLKEDWIKLKRNERKRKKSSEFDGIPVNLPSLSFTNILQDRLVGIGLNLDSPNTIIETIRKNITDLEKNISDKKYLEKYLELIIFNCVNLARNFSLDLEKILRRNNQNIISKFKKIEMELEKKGMDFEQININDYIK